MRELPILFSGPMVRAILDNAKTQTRRLRGLNIVNQNPDEWEFIGFTPDDSGDAIFRRKNKLIDMICKNYYGAPGDFLWVKENWKYWDWTEDGEPFIKYQADGACLLREDIPYDWGERIWHIWEKLSHPENYEIDNCCRDRRWRPSIHMPRWAARISLLHKNSRLERVQAISPLDCEQEGITGETLGSPVNGLPYEVYRNGDGLEYGEPIQALKALWDSINGKRGCDWDSNPWVRVIEFERI